MKAKRILSFVLFLVLALSLFACGKPAASTDTASQGTQSSVSSETVSASTDKPATDAPATDSGSSETTEQQPETIKETIKLTYDDRYSFPDDIEEVYEENVTSKQTGSNNADSHVLRYKSRLDRKIGIACGCGDCKVKLKNGDVYAVTVSAAPLSIGLIIGQSNGEGSTDDNTENQVRNRNRSIVCEEGQIYSTYAWSTTFHSSAVAGISSSVALNAKNANSFVPKTLTANQSYAGTSVPYPLNSLSESGKGKVGLDSALAWQWHEKTKEKIWVVNCAAGSTAIGVWLPGQAKYQAAVELMTYVFKTVDAEVSAGHYKLKHFMYFWLQGESDASRTASAYYDDLLSMHTTLRSDLKKTTGHTFDYAGNIMVRAFTHTNNEADIFDNGPRTAQKRAVNATTGDFKDFYMACDVNDQWISDANVKNYWRNTYVNSEYPFTVHGNDYENPTTIAEIHNGTHYMQIGYNEIGITCALNAAKTLKYK